MTSKEENLVELCPRTVTGFAPKSNRLRAHPDRPGMPRPLRHDVLLPHLELLAQVVLEARTGRHPASDPRE